MREKKIKAPYLIDLYILLLEYSLILREIYFIKLNRSKFDKIIRNKKPLITVITPTYNRSKLLLSRAIKLP